MLFAAFNREGCFSTQTAVCLPLTVIIDSPEIDYIDVISRIGISYKITGATKVRDGASNNFNFHLQKCFLHINSLHLYSICHLEETLSRTTRDNNQSLS